MSTNAVQISVSTGRPGTKKFSCPGVPLSRDKGRNKNPGTNSSVPGRPGTKSPSKKNKKQEKDVLKQEKDILKQEKNVFSTLFLLSLSLCPGTRKEFLSLCSEKLHCPVPWKR